MKVGYLRATRWTAAAPGFLVLAVAFLETVNAVNAYPQRGAAGSRNARPNQPVGNPNASNPYSAAYGLGRYAPYSVKDPTAAERGVVAGHVCWTILDGWVQRATAPPGLGAGPRGEDALVAAEFTERLGRWSLRWQEAQDNAAKNMAGRQQALSEHLGRMISLEEGRFLRESVKPDESRKGRPVESKPPRLFAEIVRFFRPVNQRGTDRIVPELVEFERPLNPLGIAVTSAERVEIAARAYRAILDAAVERFLSPPRQARAAATVPPSLTPPSPSGWRAGRTCGGRLRTTRPRMHPRDWP